MLDENKEKYKILMELAAEWEAEYERLTMLYGAYGQMKIRAAYRLAAGLAEQKAIELEYDNE